MGAPNTLINYWTNQAGHGDGPGVTDISDTQVFQSGDFSVYEGRLHCHGQYMTFNYIMYEGANHGGHAFNVWDGNANGGTHPVHAAYYLPGGGMMAFLANYLG